MISTWTTRTSPRGVARKDALKRLLPDYLTLRMVSVRAKTSLQIKRVNRVRPYPATLICITHVCEVFGAYEHRLNTKACYHKKRSQSLVLRLPRHQAPRMTAGILYK